jgi:predicted ATPase/DNA-binding SARP family transcriptional activator
MTCMGDGATRADVRIALLGGFAVTVDGTVVEDGWRLRKAKTLVKLLALAPGHRLHREAVLDLLWPDVDPRAAANNLHQAIHAARRALGATRIALRDELVWLSPDEALVVDVDSFQTAADRARASGDVEQLRGALAQWTGMLLPEDAYESWSASYREGLAETHAALAAQLAAALVASGEAEAALALLEPLAAQRVFDESLQRSWIAALAALGRRWDALAAYERLRDALDREYAAEPEPETKAIYRRVLVGAASAPARTPHNLPEPTSTFIGRHRELQELIVSLERTRLLTLTGPGGAGKSRLSVELARRAAATSAFSDGVWRVKLAGVKEGEMVTSTTAATLGLALPGGRPSELAIADQLAGRSLLLVLDNCEHLLSASSALVSEVLSRCPDVRVVTTSREPLGVAGEVVYRVPSLELPAPTDHAPDLAALARLEAVQLFVERARQTTDRFVLDAGNAAAVAEICRRLDGMPLALELAAARLAHLSVADLAVGLDSALTLLARRGGAKLDRQQTLAATLDWSHELLEDVERTVLRRLAVFAGGFDIQAAAQVCDGGPIEIVELISRLVDKSLVEADTSGPSARYRLLEVVRQYAEARLDAAGDRPDAQRRHREWFAVQAAERDPDRGEPIVGEPSSWFDLEQDNLRAALSSSLSDDPALALQLATSTWRFWMSRGLIAEGTRWLTHALDGCPARSPVRARALSAMGVLHARQGRVSQLAAIGAEIAALLSEHDDPAERAFGRHQRALLAFMAGEWDAAAADELVDSTPDDVDAFPAIAASARHLAGIVALSRADTAAARGLFTAAQRALAQVPPGAPPYFMTITTGWMVDGRVEPPLPFGEETVLLGRRIGAEQAAGHLALALALTDRLSGDLDSALRLIDEARQRFDELGDRYGQAYAAAQRGHTLRWTGDHPAADDAFADSEALRRELRDQRSVAMALSGRALVAASAGRRSSARALGQEAVDMMERNGDTAGVALTTTNLAVAELLLGEPAAALGWIDRATECPDLPGAHRAFGWLRLLQAHLLSSAGDRQAADAAAVAASDLFFHVGERAGLTALQRACKAGLLRLPKDNTP